MRCASTLLLLCATERVPRPLPMLTSFTLLVPRSYTVDGDNLSPSADTVLLDNSYLPAAFATDFGSAPWTLVAPFKETCSVRVANMTDYPFAASGEWVGRWPHGVGCAPARMWEGRMHGGTLQLRAEGGCWGPCWSWGSNTCARAQLPGAADLLLQARLVAWVPCSTLWAPTARSLTTRSLRPPMA